MAQVTPKFSPFILHGELCMDSDGEAHFICHTPANTSFIEVREGITKFIALLESQLDRQKECPYYKKENNNGQT